MEEAIDFSILDVDWDNPMVHNIYVNGKAVPCCKLKDLNTTVIKEIKKQKRQGNGVIKLHTVSSEYEIKL